MVINTGGRGSQKIEYFLIEEVVKLPNDLTAIIKFRYIYIYIWKRKEQVSMPPW